MPVVGASGCLPSQVFPEPDPQQARQPGAVDSVVQEQSTRFQYTGNVRYSSGQIIKMLQHVSTPDHIKAGVSKGRLFGTAAQKDWFRVVTPMHRAAGGAERTLRQIKANRPGPALG